MADENREDTFKPTSVGVDRGRMQGLGVGQRELDGQREPGDALRVEQRTFDGAVGGEASDPAPERIQAGPPGEPDKAYGDRDADEASFSQPSGGAGARADG